MYFKYQSLT